MGNINIVIFRKLYVVILMKIYFTQFWICYIVEFLFFGVNGALYVCRSSDIWVTGCNCLICNFCMEIQYCFSVGWLVEAVLNLSFGGT